jgi:hypothetical protein
MVTAVCTSACGSIPVYGFSAIGNAGTYAVTTHQSGINFFTGISVQYVAIKGPVPPRLRKLRKKISAQSPVEMPNSQER